MHIRILDGPSPIGVNMLRKLDAFGNSCGEGGDEAFTPGSCGALGDGDRHATNNYIALT